MKKIILFITIILILSGIVFVRKQLDYERLLIKPNSYNKWVNAVPTYSDSFFKSKKAQRIGNNLLLIQNENGGFPKNIYIQKNFNIRDLENIKKKKPQLLYSTIDNNATTTEFWYLSKLYETTKIEKYKTSALKIINYLINIQYKNGGFPQTYPEYWQNYQSYITYNDRATINVLELFKNILENKDRYSYIDEKTIKNIQIAYDKGIECILNSQFPSGMWAAQYDENSLEPEKGRIFEPAAIDTRESAEIVLFLMNIENSSPEIKVAISKAVKWFYQNKIENIEIVSYINQNGKRDIKLEKCNKCTPIWARMYDINTGNPIFSDRSGKIFSDFQDIQYERRIGYEWYTFNGNSVISAFDTDK